MARMTPRQQFHKTLKACFDEAEDRMMEGYKRTVQEQGVFLKQMTPMELLGGAQRNLNHLSGPALTAGTGDPGQVRQAVADMINYACTLENRICEGLEEAGERPHGE
jgi:hypothetical protein